MSKVKKKELLERIEKLENELEALRSMMGSSVGISPAVHLPLLTRAITGNCTQCGMDLNHGGTCMSVSCPYSLKITC